MNWIPNRWQRVILFLTTLGFVAVYMFAMDRYNGDRGFHAILSLVGASVAACLAFNKLGSK